MYRYFTALYLLLIAFPLSAAELTVLGGFQVNGDFEIADVPGLGADQEAGYDVDVDTAAVVGAELDFVLNNNPVQRYGVYVGYTQTEFESDTGLSDDDLDVAYLHLTFKNYYPQQRWQHFVLGGVGVTHFSPGDSSLSSKERFSAQLAFGTNYTLTERLALRGEVRWIATFLDDSSSIFCNEQCFITIDSDIYNQVQANAGLVFNL